MLYDASEAGHKDAQLLFNTWTSVGKVLDVEGMDGECTKFV